MSDSIPKHAQILVIGGGPGGSTAASALAREGLDVVLLEASAFPRYHIGESLIPSIPHVLKFIDADYKIRNFGFQSKPGAAMKFVQDKAPGYTDFLTLGAHNHSWNVVRSEFDNILLEHAKESGAKVFTTSRVKSLGFAAPTSAEPGSIGRPISAAFTHGESDAPLSITYDYLIDASGRAGIMSTKYLKNRRINSNLKNIALWGYWTGDKRYARHGDQNLIAPWFEALMDESGWAWHIPLHNGTTSVGVVMDQQLFSSLQCDAAELTTLQPHFPEIPSKIAAKYLYMLENHAPGVLDLIKGGTLLQKNEAKMGTHGIETVDGPVRSASDFSYSAPSYAGEGYRIIGDAGAFIDPWFSTGVHLAMTGALAASASIAASIHKEVTEKEAADFHSQRIAVSYTRLLVVVLSAYRQMRSQTTDVLCDIGEDNFDKAFERIRPLIQGSSDFGPKLSETEVQHALDFCTDMFSTTPDMRNEVKKMINETDGPADGPAPGVIGSVMSWWKGEGSEEPAKKQEATDALFDVSKPVIPLEKLDEISREVFKSSSNEFIASEAEARQVLANVNARRVIHRDHDGLHSLQEEEIVGYSARLEVGNLGLNRVPVSAA